MAFEHTIELYRNSSVDEVSQDALTFSGSISFEAGAPLVRLLFQPDGISELQFRNLAIDSRIIDEPDEIPESGENIEFEVAFKTATGGRFYRDFDHFLEFAKPTLARGRIPEKYFLIRERYASGEANAPTKVQSLERLCSLVSHLSDLAHHHDGRDSTGSPSLVFIKADEGRIGKVILRPVFDDATVRAGSHLDLEILAELLGDSPNGTPHKHTKRAVFESTLAEFLASIDDGENAFRSLVERWPAFVDLYNVNYQTFVSGFALRKAKRELADAEMKLAGELSATVSDVATKLFAIPLSLVAVAAIPRAESYLESLVITVALVFASILTRALVKTQQHRYSSAEHSKNLLYDSLDGKPELYPQDLRSEINGMKEALDRNDGWVKRALVAMVIASWSPAVLAILVHLHHFH